KRRRPTTLVTGDDEPNFNEQATRCTRARNARASRQCTEGRRVPSPAERGGPPAAGRCCTVAFVPNVYKAKRARVRCWTEASCLSRSKQGYCGFQREGPVLRARTG